MASRDIRPQSARAASAIPEIIDLEHGTKRDHTDDRLTPNTPNLNLDHVEPFGLSTWTRRLSERTPAPVARWSRKTAEWVQGPKPQKKYTITPFFERWQTLPVRLLARLPQWARICCYLVACIIWIVVFAVVISDAGDSSDVQGLGAPIKLSCVNNLWYVYTIDQTV